MAPKAATRMIKTYSSKKPRSKVLKRSRSDEDFDEDNQTAPRKKSPRKITESLEINVSEEAVADSESDATGSWGALSAEPQYDNHQFIEHMKEVETQNAYLLKEKQEMQMDLRAYMRSTTFMNRETLKLCQLLGSREEYWREIPKLQQSAQDSRHRLSEFSETLHLISRALQRTAGELQNSLDSSKENQQLRELLSIRTSQLNVAQTFLSQNDSTPPADVTRMVEDLNHDILQVALSFADAPTTRDLEQVSDGHSRTIQDILGDSLAAALVRSKPFISKDGLQSKIPYGQSIFIQVSVQACIVKHCTWIIRSWSFNDHRDELFRGIYNNMLQRGDPAIARRWRAITRTEIQMLVSGRDQVELIKNSLKSVLLVAGWPTDKPIEEVGISLVDAISAIVDLALRINTAIGQEITSMDIQLMEICPGSRYSPVTMEDISENTATTVDGLVVGTTGIGLRVLPTEGNTAGIILLKPTVFCG